MLPLDETGSFGKPSLINRRDIIATVLEIIQGAWTHVCQRGDININCDEPTIAGALYHEMWNEKERLDISGPPHIDNESAERKSENSLKPDGFIDFKMIYGWTKQAYFGIECKRVSSITTGKNKNLATYYVTKGIMRFVKGIYSPNHDFAAMLGFVIDDKPEKCVQRIQERINRYSQKIDDRGKQVVIFAFVLLIKSRLHRFASLLLEDYRINLEENWIKEENFGKHPHLYRTRHRQVEHDNSITMLHLFVTIN